MHYISKMEAEENNITLKNNFKITACSTSPSPLRSSSSALHRIWSLWSCVWIASALSDTLNPQYHAIMHPSGIMNTDKKHAIIVANAAYRD